MFIGVDISKDFFHAYTPDIGVCRFSNTPRGYRLFKKKYLREGFHVVMEASGVYHYRLAHRLCAWNMQVSVANPISVRRFCQMNLSRVKSDSKDAQAIYHFARLTSPRVWIQPPRHLQRLAQLQSVSNQLVRLGVSIKLSGEQLNFYPAIDRNAVNAFKHISDQVKDQISSLDGEAEKLIKKHYSSVYQSLVSIPAIGPKTAKLLIIATDGFKRFDTIRQLAAFTGLTPSIHRSGTSIYRRARITRKGNPELRKYLYLCAMNAIKSNAACKSLYKRLKDAGRPSKLALIAVAHKLLKQAFAIAKSGKCYDSAYPQIDLWISRNNVKTLRMIKLNAATNLSAMNSLLVS